MNVFEKIGKLLDEKGIKYEKFEHEPVLTSEQAAATRGNPLGMGAKAMVMRSEGKFVMAVISGEKKIDMKKLKKIIRSKSLSFATSEEVMNITGCEVGGVPPFGNLFDIPVFLDKHIMKYPKIDFNAGLRTHSIEMPMEKYVEVVKPRVSDFAKPL